MKQIGALELKLIQEVSVDQIYNQNDSEQISAAARYLHCEELDILEAIDNPGKVIETTTIIKTIGDI